MQDNYLKSSLSQVFSELNDFIADYNSRCSEEGGIRLKKQELKIVGQTALFMADLPFPITATTDLDLVVSPPHAVQSHLRNLLQKIGIVLDSDSRLIWMPDNTAYHPFFDSLWTQASYADSEAVMLSKYKFNRHEDGRLIQTYLQYFPGFKKVLEQSELKEK